MQEPLKIRVWMWQWRRLSQYFKFSDTIGKTFSWFFYEDCCWYHRLHFFVFLFPVHAFTHVRSIKVIVMLDVTVIVGFLFPLYTNRTKLFMLLLSRSHSSIADSASSFSNAKRATLHKTRPCGIRFKKKLPICCFDPNYLNYRSK